MSKLFLPLTILALLFCSSCNKTNPQLGQGSRSISSLPSCLEATRDQLKENIYLRLSSRYWVAASIICSDPENYDLDKIISFYKDLKEDKHYHSGPLNTGIAYYPPLIIAINLNGDKSKLTCLAEKKDDLDKSSIDELRKAPKSSKYLIASRLCSKN